VLPNSIKARLITTVVVSQLLLATGLVVVGVFSTESRLQAALDTTLQARATRVAALVRYSEDGQATLLFDDSLVPASTDPQHPDFYEIRATDGSILARSTNWPHELESSAHAGASRWNLRASGLPYRALRLRDVAVLDREEGQPTAPAMLAVTYAACTVSMQREIQKAGFTIATASLALLLTTVLLALWGIRRGLLPLDHLAEQAAHVSAQNWEFHPPADTDLASELTPLTQAMQTMLERLRLSFTQQREFLGNAAHELKTPVAILKSTLQSLLQKPRSTTEYQEGLAQALEDMDRLEKLLRWMLQLARAEQRAQGGLRAPLALVDIAQSCEEAIEGMRGLAQARNVTIQMSGESDALCKADPDDLELVWVNLLDNAVRYSPEGAVIRVTVNRNGGDRASIIFQDNGAGIPSEELPHIFERFHRADPSRTRETGGFGLGLAIAKALIEAYGGSITATSQVDLGTRMVVELPSGRSQVGA